MNKSLSVARGGIYTALSVLTVYAATFMLTSKLFLLGIASCIIPVSIITINIKYSLLVYLSTAIICLLLFGIKAEVAAYAVFFGTYGFIKYYVERLRKLPLEIVLKIIFFNISLAAVYLISKIFFKAAIIENYTLYPIVIAAQVIFLIYDYVLTIAINYINKHYIKKIF